MTEQHPVNNMPPPECAARSWLTYFGVAVATLRDVPTSRRASLRILSCLSAAALTSILVQAQASPNPATSDPTVSNASAPKLSPISADGYFPVSAVHRGLHGVAYTVFEGTQPEAMQVEILGVLRNALGPKRDMILARLHGSKPEYTGVVAGMSGSPVYIDGKLLGALSYRIGQFSKEPIAGITPISDMLSVRDTAEVPEASSTSRAAGAPLTAMTPSSAGGAEFVPIETPLSLSGFSPEAATPFRDRLAAAGLTAVNNIGGGAGDSTAQADPIVPGSAVSALMVRGDVEMAATCTVTYVDTGQLLACGHPITQYGAVSMPMTKADVVATLASPLNAFKIINTTQMVGAFNQDRASAIRGTFGQSAKMIPVTLNVTQDKVVRAMHFEVIDNAQMTPVLVLLSTYQALLESNRYGVEMSYRLHGQITTNAGEAVKLDAFETPREAIPSAIATAIALGDRFSRVYANRARTMDIHSVTLDIDAMPGNRGLEIESAAMTRPLAHAGDTVTIDTVLRPYHAEARHIPVTVKIPGTLSPGPLRVVLSGAAELDRILQAPSPLGHSDLDVDATIAQLNATHTNNALYATLLLPGAQAVVDGRTLAAVPISMVNVMEPLRGSHKMLVNGESAVVATSLPLDGMVSGQQVVTIEVE